jgi:glutathione S-transferase
MKLRYSATSPYARKCLVVAIELGLGGRIEKVPTSTTDPASGLAADNPLGKIPVLLTEEVGAVYDSPVICEYLDSLHHGPKLHPTGGIARWHVLRRQALADGMTDAAILRRLEQMRADGQRSDAFAMLQAGKMATALDALEAEAGRFGDELAIDQIAIGCALGYLDFRFAADRWRDRRPKLAAWYDRFAGRPAMRATVPPPA